MRQEVQQKSPYTPLSNNNKMNRSHGWLLQFLKTETIFLSWIGLISWTFFAVTGYFLSNSPFPRKDWWALVYSTYFCTRQPERVDMLFLSISQLIICIGLLVGAIKVNKHLLQLCWMLLFVLLLKRIHIIFQSGCDWDFRFILCLNYSSVEILVLLMFITQMEPSPTSLHVFPPTIQTPLDLRQFNRGHLTDLPFNDLPPAYIASAFDFYHPSVDPTDCPPSYVELPVYSDFPPSYTDCFIPDSIKNVNQ